MAKTIQKLKIYFAGLYNDDNLGDPVIAKCTEELYKSFLPPDSYTYERVSINHFCFHAIPNITLKIIALIRLLHLNSPRIIDRLITREYIRYFDRALADADVVIVVGGGLLEFTGGRFADGLYAIARAGVNHKFPIIINATGVEGYDENNYRCKELKEMLHLGSVKYVSTRDDIITLQNKYFDGNPPIFCEKVSDSAVWASEVFDVKTNHNSQVIGLGVVRKNIFNQYGSSFSEEQVIGLYIDIYINLITRGLDVVLFTNGTIADNNCAFEIAEILERQGFSPSVIIPRNAKELVETLSKFRGVIAGRLHSCIISYSLNIPAIGLVWNTKLKLFGKEIGNSDNFIDVNKFDSDYISNRLVEAINAGYDETKRNEYRQTIIDSINHCVDNIIKPMLI